MIKPYVSKYERDLPKKKQKKQGAIQQPSLDAQQMAVQALVNLANPVQQYSGNKKKGRTVAQLKAASQPTMWQQIKTKTGQLLLTAGTAAALGYGGKYLYDKERAYNLQVEYAEREASKPIAKLKNFLSGGYTAAKKALIGISALALVSTMDDKEQRDEYIAAAKMLAMGAEKAGVISRNQLISGVDAVGSVDELVKDANQIIDNAQSILDGNPQIIQELNDKPLVEKGLGDRIWDWMPTIHPIQMAAIFGGIGAGAFLSTNVLFSNLEHVASLINNYFTGGGLIENAINLKKGVQRAVQIKQLIE